MTLVAEKSISLGAALFPPFIYNKTVDRQTSILDTGPASLHVGLSYDVIKFVFEQMRNIRQTVTFYESIGVDESESDTNSLVGGVLTGESDMSLPMLYYDQDRIDYVTPHNVSYIYPSFFTIEAGYLINYQSFISGLNVLRPFSPELWALLLLVYVASVVFLTVAKYGRPNITRLSFVMHQISFSQRQQKLRTTSSQKCLMTFYVFLAMVMLTLYRSFFLRLTYPVSTAGLSLEFDSIDKIATKVMEGYKLLLSVGGAHSNIFTNYPDERIRQIFVNGMDERAYMSTAYPTIKELASYAMRNKGTILAYPAATLVYEKHALGPQGDQLYLVIDKRSTFYVSAIAKDGLFKKREKRRMQSAIYNLNENGFIHHLSRQHRTNPERIRRELYSQKLPLEAVRMNLDLFVSFCTILMVGYSFAILIVFVECIVTKNSK